MDRHRESTGRIGSRGRLGFGAFALMAMPLAAAAQAPSFEGLGQMPGATSGGTYVNGISGDGSTVFGHAWISGTATRPYRWTAAGAFEDLGDPGGNDSSNAPAYAASLDGSVIVGQSSRADRFVLAFRWVQGAGMHELPFYAALGVSADGSVAVGMK